MDPDPGLTIVLLGNSGVGKSASGNTILGRAEFESGLSLTPVTKQISEGTAEVFGKQISVIDTPAILGSEGPVWAQCRDLLRSSRPCLFLLVFRVGPFTREQYEVLQAAVRVLGSQGEKKCHLLFTGGDTLQDRFLEEFVFGDQERSPLAKTFSGRLHLFNNKSGGQEQVRELLEKSGHLRPPRDSPADVSRNWRIVLLGRPGGGKSSSGNTILGSDQFESGGGFNPVSTESVSRTDTVGGCQVSVVDSPGLSDHVRTLRQLYDQIMKSVVKSSPGPHVFVFVVRISTVTTADIKLFELLPDLFDSGARQYCMVLFTHGDELTDPSIDQKIRSNRPVSDLVSMCAGRYCVFNNRDKTDRGQVRNFLDKIEDMVTQNSGQHFTGDRMAETFIREERNMSAETAGQTAGQTGVSAQSDGSGGDGDRLIKNKCLLNEYIYPCFALSLTALVGGAFGGTFGVQVGVLVGGAVGGAVHFLTM